MKLKKTEKGELHFEKKASPIDLKKIKKRVEGRTINQSLFPDDNKPHSLIERAYSRETYCTRLLDRDKERVAGLFYSLEDLHKHRAYEASKRRKNERDKRQKLNRSLLAIYLAKNSSKEENKIDNLILSYLILAGKSEFVYER